MKILLLMLACLIGSSNAWAHSDPAETASATVIQAIETGDLLKAKALADNLTRDYPDFKMGHLLTAEIETILLGYNPKNIQLDKTTKQTVDGLRQETQVRWEHTLYPPPKDSIPAVVLKPSPSQQHILVADVKKSRLYIFRNNLGIPELIADHYMGIGKGGFGKQKEGDMLTPIGVYKVISYIDGKKLPDLYGAGAYPINYPNPWDVINKRSGHGIWVHGVPVADYSRPPLSSEGCMTMNNHALRSLSAVIQTNSTPIVITDQLTWIDSNQWNIAQREIMAALTKWQQDWQSRDNSRYLSHYSSQFYDGSKNYQSWAQHKTRVNQAKTYIKIDLHDVSIYHYAGTANTVLVTFKQNYQSSNLNSSSRKSQLWQKQNGKWLIIYEGAPLI